MKAKVKVEIPPVPGIPFNNPDSFDAEIIEVFGALGAVFGEPREVAPGIIAFGGGPAKGYVK